MNMRFIEDWDPATVYDAVAFGPHWNGWATPVVTRETLAQMAQNWDNERALNDGDVELTSVRFEDDIAFWTFPGEFDVYPMEPGADANYDLGVLGLCFVRVDDDYVGGDDGD